VLTTLPAKVRIASVSTAISLATARVVIAQVAAAMNRDPRINITSVFAEQTYAPDPVEIYELVDGAWVAPLILVLSDGAWVDVSV
jgi:hypothetical protein